MADASSASDVRYLKPANTAKRSTPNVSSGWVVMLLSGLVAAVIFLYATQQSAERFSVAVFSGGVQPGQPITVAAMGRAEVNVPQAQLNRMVRYEDRARFEGYVLTAPLQVGDVITQSVLRAPSASDNRRAMSIPVDPERAVNGELQAGDRIDIVDASKATAQFIVQGMEVIGVRNVQGGSLTAQGSKFAVTVAVDSEDAILISKAITDGKFFIIRSTGAAPDGGAISPSGSSPTSVVR